MKKWIVKFDDLSTINKLEAMGILSYKPMLCEKLKFVFIETSMTKEEILKINGVKSCREERVGSVWV